MNDPLRGWSIPLMILLTYVSTACAESIPEKAIRHMARGEAAVEMAKSPEDLERAITEFKAATRIAPRWADPHYNLGLVQEKAEKYRDAIESLKRYLSLNPHADDASTVKRRIYKLEFMSEQVVTRDVALDIFATLSDRSKWSVRLLEGYRLPRFVDLSRGMKREGDKIAITYACDLWKGTLRTEHAIPRGDGKRLRFQLYFDNFYRGNPRYRGARGFTGDHTLEILSRQKVILTCTERFPAFPGMRAETFKYRVEYVAK